MSTDEPTRTISGPTAPSTSDGNSLPPGTILSERYRIVSLAGRGGMGEVYRAEDLKLDQTVALKLLPEDVSLDDESLHRFLNEVRVSRKVSHPNVCRVYDVGEAGGRHYLSMEWIEGQTLASVIRKKGPPSMERAIFIARQICAGLAAVHECRVLHRDMKPSNVMIDERGIARITDFGLAEAAAAIRGKKAMEGTPHYMSPEQLAGEEATVRSDLFSLGLVLFELFTGEKAYQGRNMDELLMERRRALPPPSRLATDIDPAVEKVILRCLENDPDHRPPSGKEVADALPGGRSFDEALAASQKRADRITAFRAEVAELRIAGLLPISIEALAELDRYHEGILKDLVRRFDVDVGERGKGLSLGMRVVTLIGALALAASAFYFFYRIWGLISVPSQVGILASAPALALLATAVIARWERTRYFTTMAAVFAFGCMVIDTVLLGRIFNLTPPVYAVLAWSLFALILAYGWRLYSLLAIGLVSLSWFTAAWIDDLAGSNWSECLNRPETFLPSGIVMFALAAFTLRNHPAGFIKIYRTLGIIFIMAPVILLALNGRWSYLPFESGSIETAYQLLGFVLSAGAVWLGLAKRWKESIYCGTVFLSVMLLIKYFHWWWAWMPKYLFFLIVAVTAIIVALFLRRLRTDITFIPEEYQS